ncbi:hypothetical protein EYF80_067266 [Liparis tanakae]|uniref:Uncharacterized protein n=1 Tax=Liparis tanakae TaxID=230148 RepID=A0A4Z2E297_9TELE|nr:hypothetical protein EYF80_067266 [Liparis tanakae]
MSRRAFLAVASSIWMERVLSSRSRNWSATCSSPDARLVLSPGDDWLHIRQRTRSDYGCSDYYSSSAYVCIRSILFPPKPNEQLYIPFELT